MPKIVLVACGLLMAANLLGCQQTLFDMPVTQWNQLTQQERAQIIDGYNQRQQLATQNAPVIAAIGATAAVLKNKSLSDFFDAPVTSQQASRSGQPATAAP